MEKINLVYLIDSDYNLVIYNNSNFNLKLEEDKIESMIHNEDINDAIIEMLINFYFTSEDSLNNLIEDLKILKESKNINKGKGR
jgi:hypothetical protein